MDQKFESNGCWFCKYCQQAHRDKLELFCHQVNEHPEYRDELNGNPYTTSSGRLYTVGGISESRNPDMKRQSQNGYNYNSSGQQHGNSWYQAYPSPTAVPTHSNSAYNAPVEYYVVVPNQSQNNAYNFGPPAVNQSPMVNVQVLNQRSAYALSNAANPDYYPAQVVNHPTKQDAETGWSRSEPKSSTVDSFNERTESVDYFCWKCKGRFDNAAGYIDHSKFCLCSTDSGAPNNCASESTMLDLPARKAKPQTSCTSVTSTTQSEVNFLSVKRERKSESCMNPRGPKRIRGKKGSKNSESCSSTVSEKCDAVEGQSVSSTLLTSTSAATTGGIVQDGLVCTHCESAFPSNDKLVAHLTVCKYRSTYYNSYQYKCIKCRESFEVYLDYKRHIAKHTGEVRFS